MRWNRAHVLLLGMILAFTLVGSANSYANELTDPVIFSEETIYPEAIENATQDDVLDQQSAVLVHHNEKAYVILSLGFQRSTGYSIEITNAQIKNNQLIVWASVHAPFDEYVAWVITKPMKIISVPNQNQQIQHLTVIYN